MCATSDKLTIKLPERETYLANAILSTLHTWKRHHDAPYQPRAVPWIVTSEDLQQLEEWAASLWETWQRNHDMLERSGFEIIEQPSVVSSNR